MTLRPTSRAPLGPAPSLGLALALVAGCSGGADPGGASVLLVTVDTLRADRLSCLGYERATTPNLDLLAGEGVLFERAYAHAPFTAPSHASLFTSLVTPSHGVTTWGKRLDPALPDFFELLGATGRRTGAFYNHPGLEPSELTADCDEVQLRYFEPADATVDAFLDWATASTRPFAAWVHLWDVHRPYGFRNWSGENVRPHVDREPPYLAFAESTFGEPWDESVGRTEEFYNLNPERAARPKPTQTGRRELGPRDFEYIADRYDGGVAYADAGLGRLFDGLRAAGRFEDTLLIVTSDHGEALNERASCRFTHDPFLYEETLRVPLVVRFPGGEHAGERVDRVVRGIDVLPTVLEVLDLPAPGSLQGQSLVPFARGELPKLATVHFAQTQTRHAKERVAHAEEPVLEFRQAVLQGSTKLIHDVSEDRYALYDLESDPEERVNLADDPAHADSLAHFQELLRRLREDHPPVDAGGDVSPAEAELLKAMGYVGDDEPPPREGPTKGPRD